MGLFLDGVADVLDRLTNFTTRRAETALYLPAGFLSFALGAQIFIIRDVACGLFCPAGYFVDFSFNFISIPHGSDLPWSTLQITCQKIG